MTEGRSLFSRTLLAFLGALTLLLVLIVGFFLLGVNFSIRDLDSRGARSIQESLLPRVRETFQATGRLDGETIAETAAPFLTDRAYVFVFDAEGSLVFGYRQGERLGGKGDGSGGKNFLRRHASEVKPVDLEYGGRKIGTFAAGILGFTDNAENRRFLQTLILIGSGGAAAAFLLAFAFALRFSKRLSAQAASLAGGLGRIASGERAVRFPAAGARELAQIGRSAESLQEQLVKEESLRTQWASDVAHDLRTPVAAVRTQVEAMIDGVLAATPERLERALGEISRIEALVSDLAELSRIESPGMKLSPGTVSGRELAAEVESRFALEARKKGTVLSCVSEVDAFPADEHLLLRAVNNVVQNAVQHTKAGGRVTLAVAQEADPDGSRWIALRVENSGSIPEEEIPKVFDRLFRGERARHTRGSGLGLSIAKAIVDLHRGTIGIRNTQEGTVNVTIRIPA
jgi:two-component system, OmpR family, sensor histidine kinase BaeS